MSSILPILNKNVNKTANTGKSVLKMSPAKDVFEKSSTEIVVESARDFRDRVIKPFSDWKDPAHFEKDSAIVSSLFSPFTEMIGELKKKDVEHFSRLVFGEDNIKTIEIAGKRNADVKLFLDTIEKKLGCPLNSFVKRK